jgi:DNA-binding transcriptional LysR family regulator
MNIPTDYLHAFIVLQNEGSFTKASKLLGLSQSALSQKIARLEDLLETTVFVRKTHEIFLTTAGEKLLPFAKQQLDLEKEFLNNFKYDHNELAGIFRIAGFSSIMRSAVIPAIAPWMRKNPKVNMEFSSYEVSDLAEILKRDLADVVITDYFPHIPGTHEEKVAEEEYVVIESKKFESPKDLYLDHGPLDNATEAFFHFQGKGSQTHRRGFMGDVYGILDGVALGLGRAVMSKHLVQGDGRFTILKGNKKYVRPIVLVTHNTSYTPKLHKVLLAELKDKIPKFI